MPDQTENKMTAKDSAGCAVAVILCGVVVIGAFNLGFAIGLQTAADKYKSTTQEVSK